MKPLALSPILIIGLGLSLAAAGCRTPFKAAALPSMKSSPADLLRDQAGRPASDSSSSQNPESSPWVQTRTTLDGRSDPFALLPEELWVKNQPNDQTTAQPDISTATIDSTPVVTGFLRGIILGDPPMAYVEEDGNYRKVTVGDAFSGGTIIAIHEDSLTLAKGGTRLIIRLGE